MVRLASATSSTGRMYFRTAARRRLSAWAARWPFGTIREKVQKVTLVYPGEADISRGKISVLTPIGTGQPITWETRTGDVKRLTVLNLHKSRLVRARGLHPQPKLRKLASRRRGACSGRSD
jgi:hypothetical protein